MRTGKIIDIHCKCGYLLFRYFKAGKGRLIKVLISRLSEDNVGLSAVETFSRPLCPECQGDRDHYDDPWRAGSETESGDHPAGENLS
ncbi:MAG: hypothetical protein M0Q16_02480 [Candidatus Cloacimonetes bacterium]|nr:hypothetical protein [Candidatus Cloacimonadota bacterium]MCK9184222.1 hypothetical protein [Candidatus Cloacimonadota bacterium]